MDTLIDLKKFYEKIIEYKKLVKKWSDVFFPTDDIIENLQNLRTELQRSYSFLEKEITYYGESSSVMIEPIFGKKQNVFDFAFDTLGFFNVTDRLVALDKAIRIVNKAIGKLEAEGASWQALEEKQTKRVISTRQTSEQPKAFIAHGGRSKARDKLCRFLISLGVTPLIIEEEPREGRSVNEQVEHYLKQADCAIVLGTADDKELKDGKLYPRRNVCIEIGRFQERFPSRIIYLLEEGASLPSNVSEKIHERFNQESMEEAFVKVIRELKAFGLITASKLEEQKT